tara:strand:- start:2 stop:229 length:228 start_codon:yes stop_codon:yes gene_type:complete
MVVIVVMSFFNRKCDVDDAQKNENHCLYAANKKSESQEWNRNKNWNEADESAEYCVVTNHVGCQSNTEAKWARDV